MRLKTADMLRLTESLKSVGSADGGHPQGWLDLGLGLLGRGIAAQAAAQEATTVHHVQSKGEEDQTCSSDMPQIRHATNYRATCYINGVLEDM